MPFLGAANPTETVVEIWTTYPTTSTVTIWVRVVVQYRGLSIVLRDNVTLTIPLRTGLIEDGGAEQAWFRSYFLGE